MAKFFVDQILAAGPPGEDSLTARYPHDPLDVPASVEDYLNDTSSGGSNELVALTADSLSGNHRFIWYGTGLPAVKKALPAKKAPAKKRSRKT